jgi:hypothetical protein
VRPSLQNRFATDCRGRHFGGTRGVATRVRRKPLSDGRLRGGNPQVTIGGDDGGGGRFRPVPLFPRYRVEKLENVVSGPCRTYGLICRHIPSKA